MLRYSSCASMNAPLTPVKLTTACADALRSPRPAARGARRRGAVRRGEPRPLRDRRLDLPDRAGRRGRAAQRGRRRAARSRSPPSEGVPVLPRGAGSSQCGQTVGAALVIDHSKYLNRIARGRRARRAGHGPARRRARPAQRAAEAARPVVPGRRLDQRAGDARRHGRQQLLRLALDRLRQHGAQRARHRRHACRRRSGGASARCDRMRAGRVRAIADFVRGARASASATRSRRAVPKVLRRVGGYNLDIFDRRASGRTRRRQRQPRAPAGRLRRHARLLASA